MTTIKFRRLYDANLFEMYWLEEVGLQDKLASVRQLSRERIAFLKKENSQLDETYLLSLSLDEPIKYNTLQEQLQNGK
jgi:hypothetical protein